MEKNKWRERKKIKRKKTGKKEWEEESGVKEKEIELYYHN